MKKLIISAIAVTLGFTVSMAQTTAKTATGAQPENKYGTVSKDGTKATPGKHVTAKPRQLKSVKAMDTRKTIQAKPAPAPRPAANAYDKGRGKKETYPRS